MLREYTREELEADDNLETICDKEILEAYLKQKRSSDIGELFVLHLLERAPASVQARVILGADGNPSEAQIAYLREAVAIGEMR